MKILIKFSKLIFGPASLSVVAHLRVMNWAKHRGLFWLSRTIEYRMQRLFGIYVSSKAQVADQVFFPHPIGIVIGEGVTIGANTTIYQNVTLGAARKSDAINRAYPYVSEDCIIYAGAVIVGGVRLGRAVTVGANAFVNKDVPDGATAMGNPLQIKSCKRLNAGNRTLEGMPDVNGVRRELG